MTDRFLCSYLESLIVASLGNASPASISTALIMPTGTGHAVWKQCLAPIARLRKRDRWHLLVRGPVGELQAVVREAVAGMGKRETCTVTMDVDPVSLM